MLYIEKLRKKCVHCQQWYCIYFCFACEAWSTHRDHVSVRIVAHCHTLGFRSIIFEGMHQFHSNFTVGWSIIKYRPSLKVEVIHKILTFLQNNYIWYLLTIGHDFPVPVDEHDSDQNFTPPPEIVQISLFFYWTKHWKLVAKWDLCFGFISFSKITLRQGYKFNKFALFDFCFARDTSDSQKSSLKTEPWIRAFYKKCFLFLKQITSSKKVIKCSSNLVF